MAHALLALFSGFAAMVLIVAIVTSVLQRIAPEWVVIERHPRPAYVLVNLGNSFLAAAAGGYVTAWIAQDKSFPALLVLAVIVLVLGAMSALHARGRQPGWYQAALLALAPLGVVAGGLVRLRVLGVL